MSEHSDSSPEQLEHTARTAREQLLVSLNQLEQRTKHMASTAMHATAAGGWTVAAVCAFFVSMSLARRAQSPRRGQSRSTMALVWRTAAATAGMVATGVLVYSAQRRARALAALGHDLSSVPRLSSGTGNGAARASYVPLNGPGARA